MSISLLERHVEIPACAFAEALGIKAKKLKLASEASWPDRTFMYRGHVMFIEFKRPGELPTPLQQYTINDLTKSDFEVKVCSDLEHAKLVIIAWRNHVDQQLARLCADNG